MTTQAPQTAVAGDPGSRQGGPLVSLPPELFAQQAAEPSGLGMLTCSRNRSGVTRVSRCPSWAPALAAAALTGTGTPEPIESPVGVTRLASSYNCTMNSGCGFHVAAKASD